ncbi:MAG: hypothetical protein Ct9H300mP1_25540 [Planctomycetaceae bacterium]|nr:MAG: hypothetical protein Ct9H300mP1_25540 [Planctomycetaceae bacterium]
MLPSTVIGFPQGHTRPPSSWPRPGKALADGPRNSTWLSTSAASATGARDAVTDEIRGVLDVTRSEGAVLKVIFETCFLDDDPVRRMCEICSRLEVDFVKTSTGFGSGRCDGRARGVDAERVSRVDRSQGLRRHPRSGHAGGDGRGWGERIGASGTAELVSAAPERFDAMTTD